MFKDNPVEIIRGLYERLIEYPEGPAIGRAISFHLHDFEPRIIPSYDLINAHFGLDPKRSQPGKETYGKTLLQFIEEAQSTSKTSSEKKCLYACNSVHTNFVRGNGFVIAEGKLIFKPPSAVALDGDVYRPLGYHPEVNPQNNRFFPYETLVFCPGPPELRTVTINNNSLMKNENIRLAISGPALVRSKKNVVEEIKVRKSQEGQTLGNEINYDPYKDRTYFTAFGIEENSGKIIILSMFAGKQATKNEGITLNEMADLMVQLGASSAIAGGGSGDTQQYVHERNTLVAEPRYQQGRPQVKGLRGLGAIFCLFEKG